MNNKNILYKAGDYIVRVTDKHWEEGLGVVRGYGVVNVTTGVQEINTGVLYEAVKWAKICDANTKSMMAEPVKTTIEWPAEPPKGPIN